jgi:hypothetical protein
VVTPFLRFTLTTSVVDTGGKSAAGINRAVSFSSRSPFLTFTLLHCFSFPFIYPAFVSFPFPLFLFLSILFQLLFSLFPQSCSPFTPFLITVHLSFPIGFCCTDTYFALVHGALLMTNLSLTNFYLPPCPKLPCPCYPALSVSGYLVSANLSLTTLHLLACPWLHSERIFDLDLMAGGIGSVQCILSMATLSFNYLGPANPTLKF